MSMRNERTGRERSNRNYHDKRPKPEKCRNCPYGRDSPCIGWCTKKILQELGLWETRFK